MTAEDRRRTARHEAGHLLATELLGLTSDRMSVLSNQHDGRVWQAEEDMPLDDAGIEARIVLVAAGEATMRVFGYPWPESGSSQDRRQSHALAERLDPEHPAALVARCLARAETLLRDNRPALDRLAATVLANGRIGGSEVVTALAAALNDLPTPLFYEAKDRRFQMDFDRLRARRNHFEEAMRRLGLNATNAQRVAAWRAATEAAKRGDTLLDPPTESTRSPSVRYERVTTRRGDPRGEIRVGGTVELR